MRNDRNYLRRKHLVEHVSGVLENQKIGKLNQQVTPAVNGVAGGICECVVDIVGVEVEIAAAVNSNGVYFAA